MAVNTVGMSSDTLDHLLLDAGAIYKNLTFDDVTGEFTGTLLGATSDENEFQVEVTQRVPEINGMKSRVKGFKFIEAHEAQLVVNLKEITAENIKTAIGPSDIDTTDTNYDVVTGRNKIELTDYLENIAFVGRLSGNSKPVVIVLENALSAEGFTMSSGDDGEAVIPITFHAHLSQEDLGTNKTPYKIYYPKAEA